MNRSVLTKTLIAALVVAAPLAAQDHDAKFRFGGQWFFVNPIGNLSDIAGANYGASIFGEMSLTEDTAIRGRVDYIRGNCKTSCKYRAPVRQFLKNARLKSVFLTKPEVLQLARSIKVTASQALRAESFAQGYGRKKYYIIEYTLLHNRKKKKIDL